ncbi:MAG: glycosyltransferase family 1 protein [Parvularculaceae bacterium]|nr:glycosyltransferase family 1 protein [Parvularculaceae bacterium]
MKADIAEIADRDADVRTPLRVALFSGNYNYVMDGPVRALNKLVAHLEARGHKALVFAPTSRKSALDYAGELVSVPSLALPGSRSEYRLGLGLRSAARRRLEAFKPTIIHVAAPDWLGFSALNYARKHAIPVVASFHTRFDTYPRYYGMAWLERHITAYMRYFYHRCERVYAPSQSMVDELARDAIGRDVRLWARGVDKSVFNPGRRDLAWRRAAGVGDDDVLVAFVGRIVLEKGIDIFAEAVKRARMENPKIRALIVGEGPERGHFENKLKGGVFTGFLEGEALARAYACADIFFNPSVTETFGNVTLEAMASGLPAICAAASGSCSLVDDGETGLLIADAADVDGFAGAIGVLARDGAARAAMAERARRKSDGFDWDAILDRLIADYRDVASR